MGVLIRELSALYRAFRAGQADPLPPLAIQYADYAAWQRQWLKGERLAGAGGLLAQHAGGRAGAAGAADRPAAAGAADRSRARSSTLELDAELTRGAERVSQQHGTTLFMTLLAAGRRCWAGCRGRTDVVIGTPMANRSAARGRGADRLLRQHAGAAHRPVGRADRGGAAGAGAADGARGAGAQDLPFEQVVEVVQPPRRLGHSPLFQAMFAWQSNEGGPLELPGLTSRTRARDRIV